MRGNEESLSPQEWGAKYQTLRPRYEEFASRVRELLAQLLAQAHIDAVQIECRAKDVSSFVGKVERKRRRYADPLSEMTDLAGVRVVVYYPSTVTRVVDLITREFNLDEANSLRKADDLEPDRFGYLSDHLVVRLSDNRSRLSEWASAADLTCEIQVRTVLQHAWAAIDHKLDYKSERGIPNEYRRSLFRVSALLEVADREFDAVRTASEELHQRYTEQITIGDLGQVLNEDSVEAYVRLNERARRLVALGRDLGWEECEPEYGDLLAALDVAGATRVEDLDEALGKVEAFAPSILRLFDELPGPASDDGILLMLYLAAIDVPVARLRSVGTYTQAYWQRVQAARRSISKARPSTRAQR